MSTADSAQNTEGPTEHARAEMRSPRRYLAWSGAVLVAAPTLYLSFNAGGFFVTAPAVVAVVMLVGLLVHATTAARPFAGVGRLAAVAIAGAALFAGWTLLSSLWSDAPGRALVEFDRALLYAATLALFAAASSRRDRLRIMLAGFVLAVAGIAVIALITRLLPDVWPLAPGVEDNRLSFPLTYWNALALLVGLGAVGALHFATAPAEPVAVRVASTTLLPLFAAVMYFTLSRGSIAVAGLGALLFVATARPRGTLPVLLAALPPTVAVVLAGYDADLLTTETPAIPAAVDQGHRVAVVIVGALAVTALLRLALVPMERRLRMPSLRLPVRPWVALAATAAILAGGLVVSGVAEKAVESFGDSNEIARRTDERSRLLSLSNNGRFDHWRVAIEAFEREPLHGRGAGTYQNEWARERTTDFTVIHAHSLYAQVLGELGIVGLGLLVLALIAIVAALIRRVRDSGRGVPAAVLAMTVMWLLHAGIDWDWELPAVTWWMFAFGGAALAVRSSSVPDGAGIRSWLSGRTPRLVVGILCLVLAVTPARLALSQIQLDRAAAAFERNDCGAAIDHSLASISMLPDRPQPYMIAGFCDVRLGADRLAVDMLRKAVDRDPDSWEVHYGLALVKAAAGEDPRPEARRARALNPLDVRARHARRLYARGDRERARQIALAAPLPW